MSRNLPFLAAMLALVVLGPAVSAAPLTVHPSNPRYFTDGSGKAVYLTGFYTGLALQDQGPTDPPPVYDYNAYLNMMVARNNNFIRLWMREFAKKWYSDHYGFCIPPVFARTGSGTALDGKPKFNVSQFNQEYFDRLRTRVIAARDKGIYVSIMLFERFSIDSGCAGLSNNDPWKGHPFNVNNNINGINGDTNGDGEGTEIHSLAIPAITNIQKKYIEKVIDTVNDLDNVLYEISNEDPVESKDWQYEMINYIKNYENSKPNYKKHPVGMTAIWSCGIPGSNSDLFNSPADWISPFTTLWVDGQRTYEDNPPAADGSKIIILDTDHLENKPNVPLNQQANHVWVWKTFVRGNNPIYLDEPTDATYAEDVRWALGHTITYANKMNLAAMTPQNSLSSTSYCLANPGSEYLVYQPSNGSLTVNLQAGTYSYEWFNPASGTVAGTGNITATGGSRSFTPPFSGDAVLYLKAGSIEPFCGDLSCNGAETCSSCPQDCGQCPSQNPIAHWKLDETSGITASDSSGNGNTGTLVNGPAWTVGKLNGALSFDGVNDYILVGQNASINNIDTVTISAWVYAKSYGENGVGRIVDKTNAAFFFVASDSVVFGAQRWSTTDGEWKTTAPISLNGWHHVAFTYNYGSTANVPIIYVDGVSQSLTVVATPVGTVESETSDLYIGNRASSDRTWDGYIDEVRIYNYALSPSQIQTIYSGTRSDSNSDGCVSDPELTAFIDKWKVNNQDVTLKELMEAIGFWKGGGC